MPISPKIGGRTIMLSAMVNNEQARISLPVVISRELRHPETRSLWILRLGAHTFHLPKGEKLTVGGNKECDIYLPTLAAKGILLTIKADDRSSPAITPGSGVNCTIIDQNQRFFVKVATQVTTLPARLPRPVSFSLYFRRAIENVPVRSWAEPSSIFPVSESPLGPTIGPVNPAKIEDLKLFLEQYCWNRTNQANINRSLPVIYSGLFTGVGISGLLLYISTTTAHSFMAGLLGIFCLGSLVHFFQSGSRWRQNNEGLINRLTASDSESIAESLRQLNQADRRTVMKELAAVDPEKAYAVRTYLDSISRAILGN